DHEALLEKLARLVVPYLADWCLVDEVSETLDVRQVGAAHVDPAKEPLLRELRRHSLVGSQAEGIAHVLQTDRPELHPRIPDSRWMAEAIGAQPNEALERLGASSCMIVPLSARGRILGVMTLVSSAGRRFSAEDFALADLLRIRAGLAIDNARLYEEARN